MLALFALARAAYLLWGPFDLSPDEAHYWEWSRRLGMSYYSKGPAVAWVIAFFAWIFGPTAFGVRAGAVVFSTLASYLLYLLARDIFGDERDAFYAALLANIVPIFAAGAVLMTTDVLFVFFWTAAALCVNSAIKDGETGAWRWYLAGAAIGLGFLSKYTMVLIYPCLLLFFFFAKKERFWLRRREPYLCGLISLAIATPVIYWNISHGQVTIKHTMGQAHVGAGAGFSIAHLIEFAASQAALITPLVFAACVYGLWRSVSTGMREGRSGPLLAFFTSAPLFAFFLMASLHGKVQANWAVASYVTAFAAAPWAFRALCDKSGPKLKGLLKYGAIIAIAICAVASVIVYEPAIIEAAGARRVISRPPFNRVTGWRELGDRISGIEAQMPKDTGVFIISDTYQITSELAFYVKGNPVAYNAFTGGRRMNQYDLWPGYDKLAGYNAIYVKGGSAEAEPAITGRFDRCGREIFTVYRNGAVLKEFSIFRCYNFMGGAEDKEIGKY
ncbi:MAG: glycosyltransferase family 39 protein [Deltaproteobacteria bacterium]|nr:glycosyltransferase family 39 protein [Deltaproteobacteria bacterium]